MNTTPAGSARPASPDAERRRFAVGRTRIGGWWVALVAAAFVLLLLLIFVLQNLQAARISFLGAQGSLPLGIALLLAAVGGILIVAIPGTGRIIQLRRLATSRLADGPAEPDSSAPPGPFVDQTKPPTQADDGPGGPDAPVNSSAAARQASPDVGTWPEHRRQWPVHHRNRRLPATESTTDSTKPARSTAAT